MELEKNSDVKSKRRCFNQTSHLVSYSEEAEQVLARDVAAGANYSELGQAHSVNVSELKLSEESLPYLSSSLDADIELYNKKRMRICCARVDKSKKEASMLGGACDNTHVNCGACDKCRQSHLGEDSLLEYLSASEQDFDDRNSSSEFSEQRETIGIETLKLTDAVREVPGDGVAKEQNLVDVSEDFSPVFDYDVVEQTCPEAAMPELPHLLQDTVSLPDCSGVTCDHQEEQTRYHTVVYGSILESGACGSKERVCPNLLECDSLEKGEVKDIPLIHSAFPPQTATSEEVSENNDKCSRSISVKQDGPLLSPQERAPAVAVQFCECTGDSDFYSCEESGMCTNGASCVNCTAKEAESKFPVSAILTCKNLFFDVDVPDKSSSGNTGCLNLELEHCENLKNITSDSTINQAVDVSSDFRACFTTSRSTSAQVCLSSRAINTEITMMNKSRPVGWHREKCADVACNTNWSCGASSTEEIRPQLTEMLEEHADGNTATAERSSQIQEQQELKNELCSSDLKISTDRPVHLDKQAVKNSASSYCQKILQRAIEAELQVLNAHYQMCCQHCLKIYKLALEENACFSRCNGNTELGSSLMLVLEELKKNYNSMRMKIKMGIPLNALPPLSVEIKLFPISSSYVPCKSFREDLCYDSVSGSRKADSEAPKLQARKISVNVDNPQTVCLIDGGQPSDSTSSKTFEEQLKDQDVGRGFMKNEEGNEYWFDAKEDLTVVGFSVISEETKKQQEKRDTVDLRGAKITESGNECSFIHVSGLSSLVSEDTGENFLQKASAPFSTNSYDAFISPNTLNLSSFTKLMKKLQEIHPEASRDKIVDALLEVRKNNKGILSGLSISSIVERTSVILRRSMPSCEWEKQCK